MNEKKTEHSLKWTTGMNAVYLISCALHGTAPDLTVIGDLDSLLRYCTQHSIVAMAAMALEAAWKITPPDDPAVMSPWKQAKDKAIRKNILLNAERSRILAYLDSIGCWYMPLKGSLLQYDYPKFSMRQMSDNDILFDAAMAQQVHDFMVNSGYQVESFGEYYHDEYLKAPVYNFEMHRRLVSPTFNEEISDYYDKDIHDLLVKDDGNLCGYHLKPEDFYVYMTVHAYKHFSNKGTGIRTLIDGYVFLDRHPDLDWHRTERELERLGVLDYERKSRSLAQKLLGQPRRDIALTDAEGVFLSKFLGAGTYGNRQQMVENNLDRMAESEKNGGMLLKLRYFWNRVFPPLEFMVIWDPTLEEKPWLLPVAQLRRLGKALVKKPKRLFSELMTLVKYQQTEHK